MQDTHSDCDGSLPLSVVYPHHSHDYSLVVKPNIVMAVDKMLLRHAPRYLTPTGVMIVIALQQLAYRPGTAIGSGAGMVETSAFNQTVAEMAGISLSTWSHKWKPMICNGAGVWPHFVSISQQSVVMNGVSTATSYRVAMDTPIPPHVAHWLHAVKALSPQAPLHEMAYSDLLPPPNYNPDPADGENFQKTSAFCRTAADATELRKALHKNLVLPKYWLEAWMKELNSLDAFVWLYIRSWGFASDSHHTIDVPTSEHSLATLAHVAGVDKSSVSRSIKRLEAHDDGADYLIRKVNKDGMWVYRFPYHLPITPSDRCEFACRSEITVANLPAAPTPTSGDGVANLPAGVANLPAGVANLPAGVANLPAAPTPTSSDGVANLPVAKHIKSNPKSIYESTNALRSLGAEISQKMPDYVWHENDTPFCEMLGEETWVSAWLARAQESGEGELAQNMLLWPWNVWQAIVVMSMGDISPESGTTLDKALSLIETMRCRASATEETAGLPFGLVESTRSTPAQFWSGFTAVLMSTLAPDTYRTHIEPISTHDVSITETGLLVVHVPKRSVDWLLDARMGTPFKTAMKWAGQGVSGFVIKVKKEQVINVVPAREKGWTEDNRGVSHNHSNRQGQTPKRKTIDFPY